MQVVKSIGFDKGSSRCLRHRSSQGGVLCRHGKHKLHTYSSLNDEDRCNPYLETLTCTQSNSTTHHHIASVPESSILYQPLLHHHLGRHNASPLHP